MKDVIWHGTLKFLVKKPFDLRGITYFPNNPIDLTMEEYKKYREFVSDEPYTPPVKKVKGFEEPKEEIKKETKKTAKKTTAKKTKSAKKSKK